MYYKLSNTSNRKRLERTFGASFKHPNLYKPEVVINGFNESNLSIITCDEPETINWGISGILPEFYKEDWSKFQSLSNTLNIDQRNLQANLWYSEALEMRRCLILVTGFFTTFLRDRVVYPYYIGLKSGGAVCLAGIYNVLEDGFTTCSILVDKPNSFVQKFQNIVDCTTIPIAKKDTDFWLDKSITKEEIQYFLAQSTEHELKSNPIAKEFFNQNISYDSMLEPYNYEDLPTDE